MSSFSLILFVVHFRDASENDLRLWLPQPEKSIKKLDVNMSLFMLIQLADTFCWIVQTQKESNADNEDHTTKQIAWKRVNKGVCVMCNVCETTLFNFHWTCEKCGYVVCIDCYKSRKTDKYHSGIKEDKKKVLYHFYRLYFVNSFILIYHCCLHIKLFTQDKNEKIDPFGWLFCSSRSIHNPDEMIPTQIIAGNALEHMGLLVQSYQKQWNVDKYSNCSETTANDDVGNENGDNQTDPDTNFQNMSNDVALSENVKSADFNMFYGADKGEVAGFANGSASELDSYNNEEGSKTLQDIVKDHHQILGKNTKNKTVPIKNLRQMETIEDIVSCVLQHKKTFSNTYPTDEITGKETIREPDEVVDIESVKFTTRRDAFRSESQRGMYPHRFMVLVESSKIYPDIPHSWLCNGKVLWLKNSTNPENYKLFHVT